jgi:hypothetical protein
MGTSFTIRFGRALANCRYLAGNVEGPERPAVEAVAYAQRWGQYWQTRSH